MDAKVAEAFRAVDTARLALVEANRSWVESNGHDDDGARAAARMALDAALENFVEALGGTGE